MLVIVQESFISAFDKIGTYSGSVSFDNWLQRKVINFTNDSLTEGRNLLMA